MASGVYPVTVRYSSSYVAKIASAQLVFRTYPEQSKVVSSPVYLDPNIPPSPLARNSLVGSLAYIPRSYH